MRDRPGREAAAASTLPGAPAPTPDVEEIEHTEEAMAPPWLTILHNCDCHTFEQVVRQLMKAIGCSESRGWEIAWEVHNTGKAVVKVGAEGECVRVGNVLAAIGLVVTVVQS
jgi:ATP-dependent Clp protease adaptor protein ClpS